MITADDVKRIREQSATKPKNGKVTTDMIANIRQSMAQQNTQQPVQAAPQPIIQSVQPTISQPTYANHGVMSQQAHQNIAQRQANIANMLKKQATPKIPTEPQYNKGTEINTGNLGDMAGNAIKDTLSTIGHGAVVGTAKVLDATNIAKDYMTGNDTALINADNLLNYSNGGRTPFDKRSYYFLENIAKNRPNDLDLQHLYNSITSGKYAGTPEDIQRVLDKSQKYYHDEIYNALVKPSEQKKEDFLQEARTRHSDFSNNLLRGYEATTEVVAPTILTGGLGASAPISMAVGGTVAGENKMQQYLDNGVNYTEAAKNVPIEAAKGLVFGTALKVFGPSMQVGITQNPANLGEAAKNILTAFRNGAIVGGTANFGTQALDLFKEDPNFDYVDWGKVEQGIKEGKYADLDGYLNSRDYTNDWVSSRTSQIFWAGMLTGGFNAASQIPSTMKAVKNALSDKFNASKQLEADLKILGLEKDATPQEVRKAAHQLQKKYHSDITGTSANDAKLQEINEAYNRIQRIQSNTASSFITRLKNWASNLSKNTPATNVQPTQVNNAAVASDQALVPYANNTMANATNLGNIATQQATIVAQPAPQNIAEPATQTNLPQQINNTNATNTTTNKITPTTSLETIRDFKEVGNRKVNAYQYDNPEVKPFFQHEANNMLQDLNNAIKGERVWSQNGEGYGAESYYNVSGITREVTDDIADLLDGNNGVKLSYDDIRKGLNAIIEDHGAENIAAAKRIEMVLDKRLREGYTDSYGTEYPANENYQNFLEGKEYVDPAEYERQEAERMIREQGYDVPSLQEDNALENSNQGSFSMPENNTMLPTNDELNNFAEQQGQAKIDSVAEDAKALNLLDDYTKKEIDNYSGSQKIQIGTDATDIYNFVETAKKRKASNVKLYVGKITNDIANRVKKILGLNINGYNLSIKNDAVRKIFRDHGTEKTELPRGQVPITTEDFTNIPNTIKYADVIESGGTTDEGKPVIRFSKNLNGYTTVVTYVSDKHNNLELQTMYKLKNDKKIEPVTGLHENNAPGLNTSETVSDTALFDNSIPLSENSVNSPNGTPPTEPPQTTGGSQPPEPPSDETDEKVAELLKQRPERAKMTRTQKLEDAYRSLVNKGYYVDKLADVSGNQQLKYKYDKMLSSANEGNYVVGEKQTDNNGNVIGKSVNEIWKPVEDAGKVEEFSDYLLHKLNIDRMSLENIEDLTKAETELSDFIRDNPELTKLSPRTIQRIADGKAVLENGKVVKANPNLRDSITKDVKTTELQDLAKKYLELDKQVEILEDRKNKPVFGETVTADDSRAKVTEYEEKYPEFKEWDNDIKTFNKNQLQNMVDAGLTSEETQQLLNDMYDNYIRIQRQVGGDRPITNQRGRLKVNSPIKKAKGGNQDILPLKDSMAQQALEVKKAIARNQFGQELLNTLKNGEQVEDYGEVLQPSKNGQAPTFTVFVEGKPVTMKINEELYDAIKPSERASWEDGVIARGLQKGVVLQKTLLTSRNPIFAFTNFVRDLQTAIVNSKDTPKMLQNYAKLAEYKFAELYSKATGKELSDANKEIGRLWDLYKANGGEANTYFDFEKGTNLEEKNPVKRVINEGIDKVFALNEIIEQMPRVSEFITTLENGGTIDEAMYNAADITVNFKRGGDMAKMLDRNGASFLNASIQGLDKQVRNFTDAFKSGNKGKAFANLVIKAALIGITPALINHLLLSDDEDYQDLPDYIKDNYWLFKIEDDKFLRIPRGRDIPTFLGNIAQRTTRAIQGDEHAFDGLVDTFSNTLAPNNPIESNVFSPLVSMGTNKSWNGSDIVSSSLSNKLPEYQYDAKDTELAKWLAATEVGKRLNWSPKKIDYLLDQYSGGIGDILIPLNTKYAEGGNAFSSKFTTDSVNTNKNLSLFYDAKDELTKKKSSGVTTDNENIQQNYLNGVSNTISGLNTIKRNIEMSDLSDKDKIEQVREIQKEINSMAKQATSDYKKLGKKYDDYMKDDAFAEFVLKGKEDLSQNEKEAELLEAAAMYSYKDVLGAEAAMKKYLNYKTYEKYENSGIDADNFFNAYLAQKDVESDKDESGKTINLSKSKKQKEAIDKAVKGLEQEQMEMLYGIFNISEKVW